MLGQTLKRSAVDIWQLESYIHREVNLLTHTSLLAVYRLDHLNTYENDNLGDTTYFLGSR